MKLLVWAAFCFIASRAVANSDQSGLEAMRRIESGGEMTAQDIPSVLALLSDPSPAIQVKALRFWASHQVEADEVLMEEASDNGWDAYWAFEGDLPTAIGRAVDSKNPEVHRLAVRTLAGFAYYPGECGTGWAESLGGRSVKALEDRRESIRHDLLALFSEPNPHLMEIALQMLPEQEVRGLQPEIRLRSQSSDPFMQIVAIAWFRPTSSSDALEALGPVLAQHDSDLDIAVRNALVRAHVNVASELSRLRNASPEVHACLISALPIEKPVANVGLVRKFLDDPSPEVQSAALDFLRNADEQISEDLARHFLTSPLGSVRSSALVYLISKSPRDEEQLLKAGCADPSEDVRDVAFRRADNLQDPRYLEPLLQAVALGVDEDYRLCSTLADPANEALLLRCATSTSVNLRRMAALSVEDEEHAPSHVSLLVRMARETDPQTCGFILSGLSHSQSLEATEALKQILSRATGGELVKLLQNLNGSGRSDLIDYLRRFEDNQDLAVRRATRTTIKGLSEKANPPLT
jgi:hypothetical protein